MRFAGVAAVALAALAGAAVVARSRRGDPPLRAWVRLPDFGDVSGRLPEVPRYHSKVQGMAYEVGGLHTSADSSAVRGWAESWWMPWPGREADLLEKPGAWDSVRDRLGLAPRVLRSWRMTRLDLVPTPSPGWSVWLRAAPEFPDGAAPEPAIAGRWFEPDGRGGWELVLDLAPDGTCTTSVRPGEFEPAVTGSGRWGVIDDCLVVDGPPGAVIGGTDHVVGMLTPARTECWRTRGRPLRRRER